MPCLGSDGAIVNLSHGPHARSGAALLRASGHKQFRSRENFYDPKARPDCELARRQFRRSLGRRIAPITPMRGEVQDRFLTERALLNSACQRMKNRRAICHNILEFSARVLAT